VLARKLQCGIQVAAQTLLLTAFGLGQTGTQPMATPDTPPDVNVIVSRMSDAIAENRARVRAYSVVREYKLYGEERQKPKTELRAKIEFLPPDNKSYNILTSTGGVGEHVVRKILDHEIDLSRDPATSEMSAANYNFKLVGIEKRNDRQCYVLEASPRRQDRSLIKGRVWIETSTFHIVHVEGSPTRSPSFWTRDVWLSLDFAEVEGMWLQTATHATARVRLIGAFNLEGRDQSYQLSHGQTAVAAKHQNRRGSAIVVAGVVK